MIEDEKLGLKIAENPEEQLYHLALENTEKRMRELKLSLELDEVVKKHLEKKVKK